MKVRERRAAIALGTVVALIVTLVALVTSLFVGVGTAAAATPTYEPDSNAAGTIGFYDSSGNQITTGTIGSKPMAAYYLASGPGKATDPKKAYMSFYTPVQGQTPAAWQTADQATAAQTFPNATYPGVLGTTQNAVVKGGTGDLLLSDHIGFFPSTSTADPNVYQIRINTGASGLVYYVADVLVSGSTWTQVYPTPPVVKKTTSFSPIVANPGSPAPHGGSVTLTSTLSASDASHPAGTVHLFDGTTDKGAVTFTASTGAMSGTDAPADGAHSYTFAFTPTDTTNYSGSSSAALIYTVNPAPKATTTTLGISPAGSAEVGTTVTLTATVSPNTAAGSVDFFDGATKLGSASVAAGVATMQTGALTIRTHSLVATFVPTDSTAFVSSSSVAQNYTINPHPAQTTTTTLATVPVGPIAPGTSVALNATVTPSTAAGSVEFKDGNTVLGSAPVSGGSASINNSTLQPGSHSLTARFIPTDASAFGASQSSPITLVVSPHGTTTTLAESPASPVTQGTTVNLTATVTPSNAVGSVDFFDNGTKIGTGSVASGAAHFATASLAVGTHSLTATFRPTDVTQFSASTSPATSFDVKLPPPGATHTTLAVTPAGSVVQGASVTMKATIDKTTAQGTVQFFDGAATTGVPQTITNGTASFTTSTLAVGSHPLSATFTPAPTSNVLGSTSATTTLTVLAPPKATVTTLGVTPASPVDYGKPVTLSASLDQATAVGSIKFFDGTTLLSTAPVSAGKATFTTSTLKGGTHKLTAQFVPTDKTLFSGSTSNPPVTLVINPPPAVHTTTSLAVSPGTSAVVGKPVMLTAQVVPAGASGTVQFFDGSKLLGSSKTAGGTASFTTTKLSVGSHSLSAQFVPADPTAFVGSTSATVTITIKKAPSVTHLTINGHEVAPGSTIAPGSRITVSADGFIPGEAVSAETHSTVTSIGTAVAGPSGTLTGTFTLPTTLTAGSHLLVLRGSAASASFAFTVAATAPPASSGPTGTPQTGSGGLAHTGSNDVLPSAIGLGLLVAGGCAIVGARRRRSAVAGR